MPATDPQHKKILDSVRTRICLAEPGEVLILHEAELAAEHGVSRTPIRQVLQMLSWEGLVETRAGFGTVATPLDPARRRGDFVVYHQIILAAANCAEGSRVPDDVKVALTGLPSLVRGEPQPSPAAFVQGSKRLADGLSRVVWDHVLGTAMTVAHWRIIRWRVEDMRVALDRNWAAYAANVDQVAAAAAGGSAAAMMRVAAGITGGFIEREERDAKATAPILEAVRR